MSGFVRVVCLVLLSLSIGFSLSLSLYLALSSVHCMTAQALSTQLERYREDSHDPGEKMTNAHREVYK